MEPGPVVVAPAVGSSSGGDSTDTLGAGAGGSGGPGPGPVATGAGGRAASPEITAGASGGVAGAALGAAGSSATAGLGGSAAAGGPGDAPSDSGGTSGHGGNGAAGVTGNGGLAVTGDAGGGDAGAGGGGVARPARVLLYSFSTLDIPSVPAQLAILGQTLEGWQYEVELSEDPSVFTEDGLADYAAVGMINTCFWPFGQDQSGQAEALALQAFLQAGGGLFGTHCADVTFQSANPPALYNELIGGRASSQNFEGDSRCRKLDEHPTTAALPAEFTYTGNLDGTDFIADDSTILVSCAWDNGSGMDVAVSWVRNEGLGRVFFTNFGKVDADLTNPIVGESHILSGLAWVLGRSGDANEP